jgi:hypothetical protein
VLCHEFRKNSKRAFFLPPAKGPHPAPKADRVREHVIALRKRNLSIYDISRALAGAGHPISPVAVSLILKEEGFSRLPRRRDEERPSTVGPEKAPAADVRLLDLSPRRIRTAFGGLFLFLPDWVRIPVDRILETAGLPGSQRIPAGCGPEVAKGARSWPSNSTETPAPFATSGVMS